MVLATFILFCFRRADVCASETKYNRCCKNQLFYVTLFDFSGSELLKYSKINAKKHLFYLYFISC